MEPHPFRRSEHNATQAFTLVEMLASIAVLVLLIVFVTQLTNSAAVTITSTGKHMDSDKAARLVFDRLRLDLTRMIKRTDIDYSFNKAIGNDSLAFFSQTPGFYELALDSTSGKPAYSATADPPSYSRRRASSALVAYQAAPPTANAADIDLRRLSRGLVWADDNADTAYYSGMVFLPMKIVGSPGIYPANSDLYDPSNKEFKVISEQVFRLEYCFLLVDGTLSVNPWISAVPVSHSATVISDIAAIVIGIAVLDNTSRVIAGDIPILAASFPDAANGQDIASGWMNLLNGNDPANPFPPPSCPRLAASAVRIYQRYFYLDIK